MKWVIKCVYIHACLVEGESCRKRLLLFQNMTFCGFFNVLILDASCAFQCVILWHHCFDQSTAFFRFDKYEGFVKITPCFLHSGLHLLYLFQRLCEFFITRWPKIIHSKTETCVHVINTAVAAI